MTRKIKFCGKRIDNGEWIYGSLIENKYIVGPVVDWQEEYFCSEFWWKVIPETVGQFTGLVDKNNKEIYEGNIIRVHQFLFDGTEYENMLIGKIVYQKETMSYCLANLNNEQIQEYMGYKDDYTGFQKECVPFDCFYGLHEESFEVIGNIHDNPKLLEVPNA